MSILEKLSAILQEGKATWEDAKAADLAEMEVIGDGAGGSLFIADNLGVMKHLAQTGPAGSLQLIYVDPPFFSKVSYDAQIRLKTSAGKTLPVMKQRAYHDSWENGMTEYLLMLISRFYGFRELLSPEGSLWVHLDWHAVHYVKILLDAVFGEENFVNEIIWTYKSGGVSRRRFSRKHDTLLFYSRGKDYFFQPMQEKSYNRGLKPYRFKGVKEYRDETGWYTLVNRKDVWQLDMVGRTSAERTGYATQKPEALIRRILESCTREGDLCADFFGGSGTMAAAAERSGRRWISCDIGRLSGINTWKRMLENGASFRVLREDGSPEPAGRFTVRVDTEPAPGSERLVTTVQLLQYCLPENAEIPVAEKHLPLLFEVLQQDSLQLVDYWSVDFNWDGRSFRSAARQMKQKDVVETKCVNLGTRPANIAVRVVDIFGNSSLLLFSEKESREAQGI